MDVDEAQVEFEVTPVPEEQAQHALAAQFSPFPFTHERRNAIFARRSVMSDELVFDLLLEQASIASPQSLYPPYSEESLLHLLDAIANCPWDVLKKSCLHFYLLSHVSADVAAQHAAACALPPQFIHLAQACFLLDLGSPEDLAHAVSLLSDARIVQDLSPKILQTLSLAPRSDSSRLVRIYVRSAQPVLEDYEDLAVYLRALIEYSLADAWSFQRTFSETTSTRNQLIRTILDSCLIPPKPMLLPQFLSLPLTSYEFSLLQSYALAPPEELSAAAHAILQNLITVRLLHSGKYSDAVRISRAFDTFNAKSSSSAATPLHKAAEERQQMMRDILAVIPEVQRRQLELELNDEQGDPSGPSPSASWVIEGNDISTSWESLGASASARARESMVGRTRSGRLEGSPVPALPGRSNDNIPFGPFTPAGSAQKRKASANVKDPAKDMPSRTPMLPQLPTTSLTTPVASGTLPGLRTFVFGQSSRMGFTPPSRTAQGLQAGTPPGPNLGAGLNARNAFYEPEPSRAGPSLFARQQQGATSSPISTPIRHARSEKVAPVTHAGKSTDMDIQRDATLTELEDIMILDSDDPDAFVVRGKRRHAPYPPPSNGDPNISEVVNQNGVKDSASLFRRDAFATQRSNEERLKSDARVLPGGFTSMDLTEDSQAPSSSTPANYEPVPVMRNNHRPSPARSAHSDAQRHPPPIPSSQLKIPGALFEEDAEAEEQDHVPSLPPVQAKGGRRKRTNRASSATADSEEDDHPRTPLRRSSRLSSTGPSPDPSSPKRVEKNIVSKRTTRTTADGIGRRKRKNTDG